MSVFACRELPENWMACPMAPVLTVGGSSSLNFDNYADTDNGLEQLSGLASGEYPNIPPRTFLNVLNCNDKTTFLQKYAIAVPGDIIVIANGSYNWAQATSITLDREFNEEDPIYIVANTLGGVVFTAGKWGFSVKGKGHVFAGFACQSVNSFSTAVFSAESSSGSYLRVTSCTFLGIPKEAVGANSVATTLVGLEADNCVFDSNNTLGAHHVYVPTVDQATTNPRHLRFHHNTHHNVPQETQTAAQKTTYYMGLGYVYPEWETSNNIYGNALAVIIENNTIDNCRGDDEQTIQKSGDYLYRYNLTINGAGYPAHLVRSGHKGLWIGNWSEEQGSGSNGGLRISGHNTLVAFNYSRNNTQGGKPAFTLHIAERFWSYPEPTRYAYIDASRAEIINNVFTRYANAVDVYSTQAVADTLAQIEDTLISGNLFASSTAPQTEGVGDGQYVQRVLSNAPVDTESVFRANNVWGTNFYSTTDYAARTDKDAALFTGPGTVYVVPDPTKFWGQPTEIHAPSWWA